MSLKYGFSETSISLIKQLHYDCFKSMRFFNYFNFVFELSIFYRTNRKPIETSLIKTDSDNPFLLTDTLSI